MDPAQAGTCGRWRSARARPARAVRLRDASSSRPKGQPLVFGRSVVDPGGADRHDLQPHGRAAGRRPRRSGRPSRSRSRAEGDRWYGARHDRRQGPGRSRRCSARSSRSSAARASTSTSSGSSRRRSAARTSRAAIKAHKRRAQDRLRRRLRHDLGLARAAGLAGRAARPAADAARARDRARRTSTAA